MSGCRHSACVSSAPKATLFSPGRGPSTPECIFGDWRKGQSIQPTALGRTYSEMMVNGSPSLSDSSACSPTGKLPRATALGRLLSGGRTTVQSISSHFQLTNMNEASQGKVQRTQSALSSFTPFALLILVFPASLLSISPSSYTSFSLSRT